MLILSSNFFTADHTPYAMVSTESDKEVYDVLMDTEGRTYLRVNNRIVEGFKQRSARKLLNAAIRLRPQMLALVRSMRYNEPSAHAVEYWTLREAVKVESFPESVNK